MTENSKNIHRHPTGGILFASVLLIIIALVSLIVTFTVLNKSEDTPKSNDDSEITDEDESKDTDVDTDDTQGEDNEKEENKPPKNTTVSLPNSDIYKGPLLQLDAENPYRPTQSLLTNSQMAGLDPGQIKSRYGFVNIYYRTDGNFIAANMNRFLDSDATDAFCAMMAQYVSDTGNKNIWLRNAYYYDSSEDNKATPDVNEALLNPHAAGMAVDLQINTRSGQIPLLNSYVDYGRANYYDWFLANCHKYGYIHTGNTSNYSTFRYIGIPHASYIYNNSLSFESYLSLIRSKTADDRLVTVDANGNEWWIYYVQAADGESTDVKVFGNSYSVCGDNLGGFIVSVNTAGIK